MKNFNKLITFFIFSILTVFTATFVIYYSIYSNTLVKEMYGNNIKVAKYLENALVLYFDKLKFAVENAVASEAFNLQRNIKEDAVRFEKINPYLIPKDLKPLKPDLNFVWNYYKGLPDSINGRPLARERRLISHNTMKYFSDVHYVFEMDVNGDLVFLEPFAIQRNVTNFNYIYRDYLKIVKVSKRTSISEGYISHDPQRTQIITVATPIFNAKNEVARVFAASISAKTIQQKIFDALKSTLKLTDDFGVYIIDRHGHVVTSRSGENIYFPGEKLLDDSRDKGNFRNLPIFDKFKWSDDMFEEHNIWARKTQSWNIQEKQIIKMRYKNNSNIDVYGVFYPISIFSNSKLNWGILIETKADLIAAKQNKLMGMFALIIGLLCLILFYIKKVTQEKVIKLSAELDIAQTEIHQLASKVSHDIKSPLTSLEYFYQTSKLHLPEDQRIIGLQSLERIKDIINTLVPTSTKSFSNIQDKEMIIPMMERFISEKRNEYCNRQDVTLKLNTDRFEYDAFAEINRLNFMRALSNIINNSIEAKLGSSIEITITLFNTKENILIVIADNGTGIDKTDLDKVFQQGYSVGKESGCGIGLTQAKDCIEQDKGTILIKSQRGMGTTIEITLKKALPPKWFLHSCVLAPLDKIIIVDDDSSIHSLLKQRLGGNFEVLDFYHPETFISWIQLSGNKPHYRYFVDFEFLGSEINGIDLIVNHCLEHQSTLITSHYTDKEIQAKCEGRGIPLVPKESAANFPFSVQEASLSLKQLVVIDDEPLFHKVVNLICRDQNIQVNSFYSIDDFFTHLPDLPKDSKFLIDSYLGGQRGEEESKRLHDLGFDHLYICSGKDFSDSPLPSHIKSYIKKDHSEIKHFVSTQH